MDTKKRVSVDYIYRKVCAVSELVKDKRDVCKDITNTFSYMLDGLYHSINLNHTLQKV